MINLRDYQNDCIGGIRGSYRAGRRSPLLVSPTGSGKTVMFAFIADKTSANTKKELILVHRQELVDQTCKTLRAFRVDHGVIAAGRSPERRHSVQVASVQTLVRRLDFFRPDLIIIDEAHHGTAGSWRRVIDETDYFRFKCFGNGNLHLEFLRLDLVERLNAIGGSGLPDPDRD
jgi:DNA repair protein RadD